MARRGPLLGVLLSGLAAVAMAEVPAAAEAAARAANDSDDTSAWALLGEVRDQLSAESPLATGFTQTFIPSGFFSGYTDSGTLHVDLPRCLKFEYHEPFPRNFLLCGDWVYTWNPGDSSGRRFLINDSEAAGIDLLRLEVDALKGRYRAELEAGDAGRTVIRLFPIDEKADILKASVEVEYAAASAAAIKTPRLLALAYSDRSSNKTRFEIAAYGSQLSQPSDQSQENKGQGVKRATKADFQPPALEWLED